MEECLNVFFTHLRSAVTIDLIAGLAHLAVVCWFTDRRALLTRNLYALNLRNLLANLGWKITDKDVRDICHHWPLCRCPCSPGWAPGCTPSWAPAHRPAWAPWCKPPPAPGCTPAWAPGAPQCCIPPWPPGCTAPGGSVCTPASPPCYTPAGALGWNTDNKTWDININRLNVIFVDSMKTNLWYRM